MTNPANVTHYQAALSTDVNTNITTSPCILKRVVIQHGGSTTSNELRIQDPTDNTDIAAFIALGADTAGSGRSWVEELDIACPNGMYLADNPDATYTNLPASGAKSIYTFIYELT